MKSILQKIANSAAIVIAAPVIILAAIVAPKFMAELMSGIDEPTRKFDN